MRVGFLLIIVVVVLILAPQCSIAEEDAGFSLLFTSNYQEFINYSIQFDNKLPREIDGFLLHNGLGAFQVANRRLQHAFDGFAQVIKINFHGNTRTGQFTCQFLRTNQFRDSMTKGDIAPYLMFRSVEPEYTEEQKLEALVHGLHNMNVNIVRMKQSLSNNSYYLATNDVWQTYLFKPENFSDIEFVNPNVPGESFQFRSMISSAHPMPEYGTTNLITMVSRMNLVDRILPGSLKVVRIKSPWVREELAEWPTTDTHYMHSFGVTKNYTILMGSHLTVNIEKMLETIQSFESLQFDPNRTSFMYIVNHRTGRKYQPISYNDGRYIMHVLNAYEDGPNGDTIIIDTTSYTSLKFFQGLNLDNLFDKTLINDIDVDSQLRRYVIDLQTKSVKSYAIEIPHQLPFLKNMEFPAINENYRYRKYCYSYGIVLKSDMIKLSNITLVKMSVCNCSQSKVWYKVNHYPTEPKFTPRYNSLYEDDGYLTSIVLDGEKKLSYLLILDARSMTEINRAYFPIALPYRIHGTNIFHFSDQT